MRGIVRTLRLVSIVVTVALASGCATENFRTRCPALVKYPPDKQKRVADQTDAVGPQAPDLLDLLEDYGELRARCRAIEKK